MTSAIRAALLGFAIAHAAGAQSVAVADSLLRRGNLERAESLYYAAARTRPHDPNARWGLGRYVAGRGAARVAVTLFEEAIRFGGDSTSVGADLAPLYLSLGDYHSLASLPARVISPAERERARWLDAHPTRLIAPDSVMTVLYRAGNDSGYLGRVPIRINGRTVDALIAVNTTGIVVSDSMATAARLRRFAGRPTARGASSTVLAAADSIGIGRLVFTNFPARIAPMKASAIIGVDVLGKLAPTFDPKASRMTLRVSGSVPPGTPGDRFLTWSSPTDLQLLQGGGWISVDQPPVSRLLAERTWTLDAKHGQIILER